MKLLANWCCWVKRKRVRTARHSPESSNVMWRWYVRYRGYDREKLRRIGWWWSGHCARDGSSGRSGDPRTGASWCSARATGHSALAGAVSTRPNFRPTSAALNPSRNENTARSVCSRRRRSFVPSIYARRLGSERPLASTHASICLRIVSICRAL